MQSELVRVWQGVSSESTKTAMFVTHDVDEAVFLADRVLVFSKSPATVAADIRIDLPRPRLPEVRRSKTFEDYQDAVLDILHDRKGDRASDDSFTGGERS
jgi:NitT/TauT family transport system ATP-binding protein